MSNFSFVDNIPFSIAAGGSLSLPAGGWDYIYVAELSGGDLLMKGNQARVPLIVGREVRFAERETKSALNILNRGGTTATGVLFVGSGDIQDRSTVGSVSVNNFPAGFDVENRASDLELLGLDSVAGNQFYGSVGLVGVSAQYAHAQLLNPVGSGVSVLLSRVWVNTRSATVQINLQRYDTALATLVGGINKSLAGSSPAAEVREDNNGSPFGSRIGQIKVGNYEGVDLLRDGPLVLAPGEGVLTQMGSVNNDNFTIFEWREV